MDYKIPFNKITCDNSNIEAINTLMKSGRNWSRGKEIEEFEKSITSYVDRKYALSFNSGTTALFSLIRAYKLVQTEIIVPSFTYIATIGTVHLNNSKIIFTEVEQDTFGLDIDSLEKNTPDSVKAIILVHYGGLAARDSIKIREFTSERNIIFLEDAAESLGSKINNQMIGSIGDAAIFSFCDNKLITTGEGGMVVLDDPVIYERLKLIRSQGRKEGIYNEKTDYYDYIPFGFNFRLSTLQAALGLSYINRIDKIISRRQQIANYFNQAFDKISEITVPYQSENLYNVYQMYTLKFENSNQRDNVMSYLTSKGIETRVYFNPLHLKEYFKFNYNHKEGDFPVTEKLYQTILNLPIYPDLTQNEIDYIIKSVEKGLKY